MIYVNYLLVHVLHAVSSDSILDVPRELLLVGVLVLLNKVTHVVSHVTSEDVTAMDVSVQLLGLSIVAWEPLLRVGDVKTTINCSLHGSKDLNRMYETQYTEFIVSSRDIKCFQMIGSLQYVK